MQTEDKAKGSTLFREFLKLRRKHLRLSQQQLAEQAEVSLSLIGMIESGARASTPRSENLAKLARSLKLDTETIGEVGNFMQLTLSGVVPEAAVTQVARGEVRPSKVMQELSELPPDYYGHYVPQETPEDRLGQALALLKLDLGPEDFKSIQHLLKRLYQ